VSVLTLDEAKAHLNIQGTTDDAELQTVIDAAEARLSQEVGPLAATEVSRRISGGGWELVLPVTPAMSLVSITPWAGSALTLADLYLDTVTGLVTFNNPTLFAATYYDVVYDAGRLTCPDDLLFAIKELVRHLWETQRGTPMTPDDTFDTPSVGYALPNRVMELIAPHRQSAFA
jgi:hypothetical protein